MINERAGELADRTPDDPRRATGAGGGRRGRGFPGMARDAVSRYVAAMNLILIGIGGAVGAILRYGCVTLGARLLGGAFPYGVLFANVAGSFAMGLAAAILMEKAGSTRFAAFLMPGLLGGFTTFSAFSLDAVSMFEDGRTGEAAVYVFGSVALAITALAAGLFVGRALT